MLVFAAVIFLICILYSPFKVVILVNDRKVIFRFLLFGIPVGKYNQKEKSNASGDSSTNDKVKETEKSVITLSEKIKRVHEVFRTTVKLTKKYITIEDIILDIKEGTGDAASTAISAGILWTTVYSLISALGKIASINKHNVQITPVYSDSLFSVNGKCIIKTRIVYIIFIAVTILYKRKARKAKEE